MKNGDSANAQRPASKRMKMPSICVDFLKLRTAGENFVRAHRLNVADDALAHSCYALAVTFSAFLHHRRD